MKRIVLHVCAATVSFAIGICVWALCSTVLRSSREIHPLVIDNSTVRLPVPVNAEPVTSSTICKIDLLDAKGWVRTVDFCNFRFTGFYDKQILLKDGEQEITREFGFTNYSLQDVLLVDLTGDGRKEALVTVQDHSGNGSSGVSSLYYVYTIRSGRLFLLWRVMTGSEGFAGLKKFELQGRELVFEVFGEARIVGREFVAEYRGPECCPEHFSRIRVAWNGRRFRQVEVKVFPHSWRPSSL